MFSAPVFNNPWIIYRPQEPTFISWYCLFPDQHKEFDKFLIWFSPSIETWIILRRSNVPTESLTLARISSAFVCPKSLEFQLRTETRLLMVCQNLITRTIWLVCVTSIRLSSKDSVKKLPQFIPSTRICQKYGAMPKLIKYFSLVWLIWHSLVIWLSEKIVLNKSEICRSSHRSCSIRKGVLRNFTKFTGKHLCWSLFFNKVAVLGLQLS